MGSGTDPCLEGSTEYVLITGGDEVPPILEQALRAGLHVRRCPGPSHVYCPAVRGMRCPLRGEAKVAVVYLAGEHEFHESGRWQCITGGSSPTIVVLQGHDHAPRANNGFAVVGSEYGPLGVLEAIAALIDNPD